MWLFSDVMDSRFHHPLICCIMYLGYDDWGGWDLLLNSIRWAVHVLYPAAEAHGIPYCLKQLMAKGPPAGHMLRGGSKAGSVVAAAMAHSAQECSVLHSFSGLSAASFLKERVDA